MTITEVPDSEEFTHFGARPGEVTATYVGAGTAMIKFDDSDEDHNDYKRAYFDFDGLQELKKEIEVALELMKKDQS